MGGFNVFLWEGIKLWEINLICGRFLILYLKYVSIGLFGIVFSCSCQIHVKYLLNLFHQVSDRVKASLNPLVSTPFASYYQIISHHIIISYYHHWTGGHYQRHRRHPARLHQNANQNQSYQYFKIT